MGGLGSGRRKSAETISKELQERRAAVVALAPEEQVDIPARTGRRRKSPANPTLYKVRQPTGSELQVQGVEERRFYNAQQAKYLEQNHFDGVSDLADLDALLMHELLDFRYSLQLASGKTYDGLLLDFRMEEQLRQNKLREAKVIGELKRQLSLTRASRDATQGTVSDYLAMLRTRAREFGIHRNNQVTRALSLMNELSSIVGTYDRSNEFERRKTGIESEEQIVAWVRDMMIPKFHEIDTQWRATHQSNWVGQI